MTSKNKTAARTPWRLILLLKEGMAVIIFLLIAALSYAIFIDNITEDKHIIFSLVLFWITTAYFVLPRTHSFLTRIYVPDYFIGRTKKINGQLADPVNLAINGTEQALKNSMLLAGWVEADKLNIKTATLTVKSVLTRRSYPSAPVSNMYLFGKNYDLAFQQEVDGSPSSRHHVRFWKAPENFLLPGATKVDWLGAATFDDSVGISFFTLQLTHIIAANTDTERDYVISSLEEAKQVAKNSQIDHYIHGYEHFNGDGSKFFTDGTIFILNLKSTKK